MIPWGRRKTDHFVFKTTAPAGNIAGGLSTIEEKALGNLEKIGRECRYIDVLAPAETPKKGPGLYYMDTSSAAAECVTLMAAGGYAVHTFPTGQGNVIGNPIVPVLKISSNTRVAKKLSDLIDYDCGPVIDGTPLPDVANGLFDMVVATAGGQYQAKADRLQQYDFIFWKRDISL